MEFNFDDKVLLQKNCKNTSHNIIMEGVSHKIFAEKNCIPTWLYNNN